MKSNLDPKNELGFVLPVSIFLMLLVSLSGAGFMHLNFLEGRLTQNTHDKQAAFYLANTGIERARETFKIPPDGKWTTVLNGTYDGNGDGNPDYPLDPAPVFCETCLCGPDPDRGCVIPSFGDTVTSSDGLPFDGFFDRGQYEVRAFNNEPGTVDTDASLTYRALGLVQGQRKMIETKNVKAGTQMKIIVCQNDDPSEICPDSQNKNMELEYMDDRDPASATTLPSWDQDYYRDEGNLPCANVVTINGNTTLVSGAPKPGQVKLQSGNCYFASGNITVKQAGPNWHDIVIFSGAALLVSGNASFADSIMIAMSNVQLQGNITLSSPKLPQYYPAVISGGDITKGDASVNINGNIFAAGSIGDEQHPWNPNQVTGTIIGGDVYLKAAATTVTDNRDPHYYDLMPGFTYPPELVINQISGADSWSELE